MMRVVDLINILQHYPLDSFVKLQINEEDDDTHAEICSISDIDNIYFEKDKEFPVTGTLYLKGKTTDTLFL